MQAILALLRVNLRLYVKNRKALTMNLVVPILIASFFGSLFGSTGGPASAIPLGIVDEDASPLSQAIVAGLEKDTSLKVLRLPRGEAQARVMQGRLPAAIVLPAGFGEQAPAAMFGGARPTVRVWVDPADKAAPGLVNGLFAQNAMREVMKKAFSGAGATGGGGMTQPFEIAQDAVTGTRTGYNGYAHAFAGMGAQFVLMMAVELGTGLLLMRRTGLWMRLRASPITRGQLLAGYFLSTTLIASVVLALAMLVGMVAFKFRPEGAWLGWAAIVVAYGAFVAACGLALATTGRDPESTRGLAIMVVLLMVMLGGAWVPSFLFPAWLQQLTVFIPVRHAVDGFDAVLWRGLGDAAAVTPVAVLAGSSALLMLWALWKFEWNE